MVYDARQRTTADKLYVICASVIFGCILWYCLTPTPEDVQKFIEWCRQDLAKNVMHLITQSPVPERDFATITALGSALVLRQKFNANVWLAMVAFAATYLALDYLQANQMDVACGVLLWTFLLLNWRRTVFMYALLKIYDVLGACTFNKDLLNPLENTTGLNPIVHHASLAMAPYLTIASNVYTTVLHDSPILKYVLVAAMVLQQICDWGSLIRWYLLGGLVCIVGYTVPLAVFCSLEMPTSPKVLSALLYAHTSLTLYRCTYSCLSSYEWLLLAVTTSISFNIGRPDQFLAETQLLPFRILSAAHLYLLSLDAMIIINKYTQRRTAHRDIDAHDVEWRSRGMVYVFSEPDQAGRQWSFSPGTHRWGWWWSWLGIQCRSMFIPNGLEVRLELENGFVGPFDASSGVNLSKEMRVRRIIVREVIIQHCSSSPPDWALRDDGSDQVYGKPGVVFGHVESEKLGPKKLRQYGPDFSRREVLKLERSPEFLRFRRSREAKAILRDLPLVFCVVGQFWYMSDTELRGALTIACACTWSLMSLLS